MIHEMMLTYQTRPKLDVQQDQILNAYSELLNKVERCLYAQTAKGKAPSACKAPFLKLFGITARQFNACHVSLEGKIASARASQTRAVVSLTERMILLDQQIQRLKEKPSKRFALHQKQRRKARITSRLERLKQDIAQKKIHLCFGSKKLFHAQYHLEQNGFASHKEWQEAWQAQRTSEFFILGSKDETAGNQTCAAFLQPNGQLQLRLRLPRALESTYGKYLEIENVFFQKPIVVEALDFQKKRNSLKEANSRFARMLSSFAYRLFFLCLITRAFKSGITVHRVNPAFTSIIGRVKYAKRYGLSIHLAAALCIARRHQKFSEAPRSSQEMIPDGKGSHVAFVLPERNRTKHVWHFWSEVKKKLTTALAAHFRAIEKRSLSPPGSALAIAEAPDCCPRNSGT
jgi:IS605 OrfB family transposase